LLLLLLQDLEFHGHEVVGKGIQNQDGFAVDDRKVIPRLSKGEIIGKTSHQIFAKTTPILVDGMCGGPVCIPSSKVGAVTKAVVCGLVEGIVPANHPSEIVRNSAVFVENGDIRK
jgi:hypothetical protein